MWMDGEVGGGGGGEGEEGHRITSLIKEKNYLP